MKHIDIVFDGAPGPESAKFVEVENEKRESIRIGEWIERDDGYWVLRIPDILSIVELAIKEEREVIEAIESTLPAVYVAGCKTMNDLISVRIEAYMKDVERMGVVRK